MVPSHLLGVFHLSHHLSERRRGAKLVARALCRLPGKVSAVETGLCKDQCPVVTQPEPTGCVSAFLS